MSKKKEAKEIKLEDANVVSETPNEGTQEQPAMTKTQRKKIEKAIKQALQEAELRFEALSLAIDSGADQKNMFEVADSIYNYAFHLKAKKE